MTLDEIRSRYPQYNDLSDKDLSDRFYQKFYSDMDRTEFDAKIGLGSQGPIDVDGGVVQAGVTGAVAEEDDEIVRRGALLPIGRTESGQVVVTLPEFLHGPLETIKGIMSGEKTEITAEELFAISSLVAGGNPAMRIPQAAGRLSPVAQSARRIGVDLPRAAATDSSVVQQTGKIVQSIPGGGQPLRKASERATVQLGEAATRVEESLGGGSAARAGAVVERGVTEFAGREGVLAQRAGARLDRVDAMVDPGMTHRLSQTATKVAEMTARHQEAGLPQQSAATKFVNEAITRTEGLTYQGIKRLRSRIGEMIGQPDLLPKGASVEEFRALYKTLSADLKTAVRAGGGDAAVRALEVADAAFAKTMQIRENLQRVLNVNSDEAIISRIEGMAGSTSRADIKTLAQVMAAVGRDGMNEISSALVSKMGRGPEGEFSARKFLTAWGKVSPNAKRVMFTGAHSKALDDIAAVSSRFKELEKFANPSGTGQTVIGTGLLGGGLSAFFGSVTGPLTALGTVITARVLSNILAKPQGAPAAAAWAKAYTAFARNPGATTAISLRAAARALAASIAEETGEDRDAIVQKIGSIRQGA